MSSQLLHNENAPAGRKSADKVNITIGLTLLASAIALLNELSSPESADLDQTQLAFIMVIIFLQIIGLLANSKSSPSDRISQKPEITSDLAVVQSAAESALPSREESIVRKHLEPKLDPDELSRLVVFGQKTWVTMIGDEDEIRLISPLDKRQAAHVTRIGSMVFSSARAAGLDPAVLRVVKDLFQEVFSTAPPFVKDQLPIIQKGLSVHGELNANDELLVNISFNDQPLRVNTTYIDVESINANNVDRLGSYADLSPILKALATNSDLPHKESGQLMSEVKEVALQTKEDLMLRGLLPAPCKVLSLRIEPEYKNEPTNKYDMLRRRRLIDALKDLMPESNVITTPIDFPVPVDDNVARMLQVLKTIINPMLASQKLSDHEVFWITPDGVTRSQPVKLVIVPFYGDGELHLAFTYDAAGSCQEWTADQPEAKWFTSLTHSTNTGKVLVYVMQRSGSGVAHARQKVEKYLETEGLHLPAGKSLHKHAPFAPIGPSKNLVMPD